MEKTLWYQWYTSSQFIATIEKPSSYKSFFFWSGNYHDKLSLSFSIGKSSTIAKLFCFGFRWHNKVNLQTLTYIFYKSTVPAKIRSVAFGAVLLKLLKSAFHGRRIAYSIVCTEPYQPSPSLHPIPPPVNCNRKRFFHFEVKQTVWRFGISSSDFWLYDLSIKSHN